MKFAAIILTGLALLLASPALAQESAGSLWQGAGAFVPLIFIVGIFYFFIILPQNRRLRRHRTMIASLQRGDVVVTAGGLIAKVHRIVDEEECMLELTEGLRVRVVRSTISDLRSKGGNAPAKN